MKKTSKYFIDFSYLDNDMSTLISLTKKQYLENMELLKKQVKNTVSDETPVQDLDTDIEEYDTYTLTRHYFICGCSTTRLTKIETKDGYYFSN